MKSTAAFEQKDKGEVRGAGFIWLCFVSFKAGIVVLVFCLVLGVLTSSFLPVSVPPSTNLPLKSVFLVTLIPVSRARAAAVQPHTLRSVESTGSYLVKAPLLVSPADPSNERDSFEDEWLDQNASQVPICPDVHDSMNCPHLRAKWEETASLFLRCLQGGHEWLQSIAATCPGTDS